ncbi:Glucose-6-phosphate 1-dehydrogenase [Marinomonas aquimarina]|uniref:Glucose-6-phosphate 1-dehydrogenase n=1 Tax=Marinomonas aquimarina TaxID=295068 RepID=A0A1A8TMC0_9GAMM|nr:glucose-6-phosphate dehydrogenase [Marinomonas aquimarina]SBS33715.1 Glucose-6-phosphate 1-dehydrogenase [Marinomonas aquimarina]
MKASLKACDVVIFGGGGDLAMRKLLPALYHLDQDGLLAKNTRIIGASRRDMSAEDYQAKVREALDEFVPKSIGDEKTWPRFKERLSYVSVDAQQESDFARFNEANVGADDKDVVFYLATSPDLFGSICSSLANQGLNQERMRVVLEKPLGRDLQSSRAINDEVTQNFGEKQIFRIDHYLGKETVQNLLAIRFGNTLFEPLWDSAHIDNVQITVSETVGVEGRWGYYDKAGALRDMVQNHLVQLLCLVAMEPPGRNDADSVRDEKIKVLKALRPIEGANAYTKTVRGQYAKGMINGKEVKGYFDEEGSNPESRTETFVALRADIDNWRWAGVPFYLRTGKRLGQRYSEIVIQYKSIPHSIFNDESNRQLQRNQLIIRLQPEEKISLTVMNKVPGAGEGMNLQPVDLNLSLSEAFHNKRSPEAYERLLLDVMRDDATLFMRYDEVEAAWKWVDGIMAAWNQTSERPKEYASGSWGPAASMALPIKDGRNWHDY